jgi:hypothetical protein
VANNPADPISIDFDLLKEFDRLLKESETRASTKEVELEPRYNCDRGFHKWLPYIGFRDRYYYCDLCNTKDYGRLPPSRS